MRPYISFSIDQLEQEYASAEAIKNLRVLKALANELTFRKTPRAKELQDTVSAALGTAPVNTNRTQRPERDAAHSPANDRRQSRSGLKHTPTTEQEEALRRFRTASSLKINAYAGTGKTSTLEMLAHDTPRRGQYIAFNRAIVNEAKERFPDRVNCATTHGLAYKAMAQKFGGQASKLTQRMNANRLSELLGFKRWRVDGKHTLQPRSQGYIVIETIRRFAHSTDSGLRAEHVPEHGSLLAAPPETIQAVREFAIKHANQVWSRMLDPNDPIPLGHDGYLKLWALSDPQILADYILLDEAQDTNPVVLGVLEKQKSQIVYVGDKYQQIYEWRGAVNAMEAIQTAHTASLTTSFRFGPLIANAANAILTLLGEAVPLHGNPMVKSTVADGGDSSTILARTNAATIGAVIAALDAGDRPHLVGGNRDLMEMLRGVQELKAEQPSVVPDFFGFANWQEVVDFSKSDEGSHLQTFVNLVESRGERQLMWALNRTVAEESANVVISTAHKAKGREWRSVRLLDDFMKSRATRTSGSEPSSALLEPSELRLFYVALTRAKQFLSLPSIYNSIVGLA